MSINSRFEKFDRRFWELENSLYDIKKQVDKWVQPEATKQYRVEEKEQVEKMEMEEVVPVVKEEMVEENVPVFSTFKTIGEVKVEPENKEETIPVEEPIFEEPSTSWWERFSAKNPDLERFIGENLISKIGIAILVLGIGYFVKYAIDKNWINEIARVGIGFLAGSIVLGFAHYLRQKFKAFSSVLVAGGIAVFYFTLSIAFQEYHIFSQTTSFVLMSVVTAFSVFISLKYDREELAILSVIGGFSAPLMVSTGEGNYLVLFTYLLVLDASLMVLAFYRNWSVLNGVTYVLTLLMYGIWLNQKVLSAEISEEVPYLGALMFATAFYIVFSLSNLINQIKEKQKFRTYELSLILSNSFLYFACGMSVLGLYKPQLKGVFTLLLACFNFGITYFVYRQNKVDKNLFYLLLGLTLTFVTLVAPLQLEGNYITIFWAAEASLLLWLAQKSKLVMYRLVSFPIWSLGLISMLMDWTEIYGGEELLTPIINTAFLSSLSFISSSILYIKLLQTEEETNFEFLGFSWHNEMHKRMMVYLFLPLLYFSFYVEVDYHLNQLFELSTQVGSYLFLYHLVFVSALIFVYNKKPDKYYQPFVITAGMASLLAYSYYFGLSYIREINFIINAEHGASYAYWIHYICMIPFIHQMIIWYQNMKQKWYQATAWIATIMLCFLLSTELQWQNLYANMDELINAQQLTQTGYDLASELRQRMNKSAFPILWGLLAFVLLSFGIKRAYKPLRISALSLIGITVLKLFFYDIKNVSEGGKIAAFILLGVVLLVISFTYQKIKSIILDEEPRDEE
ncbi:MAG: DUF2339 domain-containing protein [Bacteroidia bacterium]|nr:DUF2339 domain-containing protein [Bacteroidia bacterium]